MNQELSQRIVAAIVITALAAIFIPMLFDDPIDNSGQNVSQLAIPDNPVNVVQDDDSLPDKRDDVAGAVIAEQNQLSRLDQGLQPEPEPLVNEGEDANRRRLQRAAENAGGGSLDTGEVDETDPFDAADPFMAQHPVKKNNTPNNDKLGNSVEGKPQKHADQPTVKPKALPVEHYAAKDAPVEKKSAAKAKTASAVSRWYIQAGSFSKKENAMAMLETLKSQSFPVAIESKDSLYRLKVGANLDKKQALLLKQKLDQLNVKNVILPE